MVRAFRDFVPVYVDCTKSTPESKARIEAFNVDGFPSVVFVTPEVRTTAILEGLRDPAEYIDAATKVVEALPPRRLAKALSDLGALRREIESRIDALSDPDPEVRERATGELRALKEALDLALAAALKSADAEQAGRAKGLVEKRTPEPIKVPVKP